VTLTRLSHDKKLRGRQPSGARGFVSSAAAVAAAGRAQCASCMPSGHGTGISLAHLNGFSRRKNPPSHREVRVNLFFVFPHRKPPEQATAVCQVKKGNSHL